MSEKVFVDTSALYAFINAKDPDHDAVKEYLENFQGQLITTNFIFDETITLVLARMGYDTAVTTGKTLLNPKIFTMIRIRISDENGAWEFFLNRSDKTYSFTDCTSFVMMKKMGIAKSLATDPNFQKEGFQTVI